MQNTSTAKSATTWFSKFITKVKQQQFENDASGLSSNSLAQVQWFNC
jgi:hypothetical protein